MCINSRAADKPQHGCPQYTLRNARIEASEVNLKRIVLAAALLGLAASAAHAVVTRIAIDRIDSPTFDGRDFGTAGRYEKLSGRAFGEVDPNDPRNAGIVFIQEAPRNARGRVEYVVDISIIQPVNTAKGNGTLLYDVVNRGSRRAFDVFHLGEHGGNNPSKAVDAGDAFLLRQGYTLVVSGWQADVPREEDEIIADYPIANRGGGNNADQGKQLLLARRLIERGVRLTTSSGTAAEPIAQTAIAGLLMLARNYPHWLKAQRERRWDPLTPKNFPRDIRGQTILFYGLGAIGCEIARLAKALGLTTIGVRGSSRRTVSMTLTDNRNRCSSVSRVSLSPATADRACHTCTRPWK